MKCYYLAWSNNYMTLWGTWIKYETIISSGVLSSLPAPARLRHASQAPRVLSLALSTPNPSLPLPRNNTPSLQRSMTASLHCWCRHWHRFACETRFPAGPSQHPGANRSSYNLRVRPPYWSAFLICCGTLWCYVNRSNITRMPDLIAVGFGSTPNLRSSLEPSKVTYTASHYFLADHDLKVAIRGFPADTSPFKIESVFQDLSYTPEYIKPIWIRAVRPGCIFFGLFW